MGNPHQEKRKEIVYRERKCYLCSSAFHLWITYPPPIPLLCMMRVKLIVAFLIIITIYTVPFLIISASGLEQFVFLEFSKVQDI